MANRLLIERTNPLDYIGCLIAFDVKSWSEDKRNAVIYGIVFGWDDESYCSFKEKYGFTDFYIEQIKRQHKNWEQIKSLLDISHVISKEDDE